MRIASLQKSRTPAIERTKDMEHAQVPVQNSVRELNIMYRGRILNTGPEAHCLRIGRAEFHVVPDSKLALKVIRSSRSEEIGAMRSAGLNDGLS